MVGIMSGFVVVILGWDKANTSKMVLNLKIRITVRIKVRESTDALVLRGRRGHNGPLFLSSRSTEKGQIYIFSSLGRISSQLETLSELEYPGVRNRVGWVSLAL